MLIDEIESGDFDGVEVTEDGRILIREAELHELVELHKELESLMLEVEDEFDFRLENGQKLAAGDETDREYADLNRIA